jgi:hypothetical protein
MTSNDWQPYDPTWLVGLARNQVPEEPWLPQALGTCTCHFRHDETYVYFVDDSRPNEPGSAWQFEFCVELESPTEGWLILDILKDRRVGGVEFVDKI